MAITIAASALSGTPADDVIINAAGNTTVTWAIASGRYLEVPAGLDVRVYTVNTSGTINGSLRGGGMVSAWTRTLNIGAAANLAEFTGILQVRDSSSTAAAGGTLYFSGSDYNFPGTVTNYRGTGAAILKFNTSTVSLAQTVLQLNSTINLVSNAAKTTVTFKRPTFITHYNAGTFYDVELAHGAHDVIFTDPATHPDANASARQAKSGSGTVTFRGATPGTYQGTFTCKSGLTQISGDSPIGPATKFAVLNNAALGITHNAQHQFNTLALTGSGVSGAGALYGVGSAQVNVTGSIAAAGARIVSRPDTSTSTAGDLRINETSTGATVTGTLTVAPDGGLTNGQRNIVRLYSPVRTSALTINSNARLGTTPAAGQEGVVIIYGRANTGTSMTGTTTVNSGSILRVNSPDGSDRLCNGLVNVLTGATLEVEYVASAAPNVRGRHVYPGGLTLGDAARLNIGVTPL